MKLGDRIIESIAGPYPIETYQKVGKDGVDKITVDYEAGQMAAVPWFVVWKGGAVWRRYNAAMIEEVEYRV